jgi:hypothetical protein
LLGLARLELGVSGGQGFADSFPLQHKPEMICTNAQRNRISGNTVDDFMFWARGPTGCAHWREDT